MKSKKIIFLILYLIISCHFVYAKEVTAKYEYIGSKNTQSIKITQTKTNINLGTLTLTIEDYDGIYKNSNIKLIKVEEDKALSWLKSIINNDNIITSYYIKITNNNNADINNGELTCKITENKDEYITYLVSNDGSIKSTFTNNEANLNNNYYLVMTKNNIKKSINITIDGNGAIILDGKLIYDSDKYEVSSDKIIIRPNNDYIIDKVLLNKIDKTSLVENGFLNIKDLTDINLEVKFTKNVEDISTDTYSFSGQVIYNGSPLKNAKIELHSETNITYTDDEGRFKFDSVALGNHSITILHNDIVIGYTEFSVKRNTNDKIELVYKNDKKITLNEDNIDLKMIINDDYDIDIINNEIIDTEKDNTNKKNAPLIIIPILLIIGILLIVIFERRNKNKT